MKHSSLTSPEHAALTLLLRDLRLEAGLSQVQAAERLDRPQTYVSALEVGKRGIDLFQARDLAGVYGKSLPEFVAMLEERLKAPVYRPPRRPKATAGTKRAKQEPAAT